MPQKISFCLLCLGMVQFLAACTSDKPLVMSSRDEAAREIVQPNYLELPMTFNPCRQTSVGRDLSENMLDST